MFFSTVKMTSATDSVHPQLSFKHQGKWIHALFLTQCRHAGCGFLESFFFKQRKQENHRDCSGDETKVSLGSSKLVETSFGSWMLMVICWWGVDLMLYHVDDIDVFKFENASQQALVGHQMGLRVPYKKSVCLDERYPGNDRNTMDMRQKSYNINQHLVNKSTSSTPHQIQKSTHQRQLWLSTPHPMI